MAVIHLVCSSETSFFSGSRVGHVVFERSTSRAGYSWTRTTVVDRFNTKLIPNLCFFLKLYCTNKLIPNLRVYHIRTVFVGHELVDPK